MGCFYIGSLNKASGELGSLSPELPLLILIFITPHIEGQFDLASSQLNTAPVAQVRYQQPQQSGIRRPVTEPDKCTNKIAQLTKRYRDKNPMTPSSNNTEKPGKLNMKLRKSEISITENVHNAAKP